MKQKPLIFQLFSKGKGGRGIDYPRAATLSADIVRGFHQREHY